MVGAVPPDAVTEVDVEAREEQRPARAPRDSPYAERLLCDTITKRYSVTDGTCAESCGTAT